MPVAARRVRALAATMTVLSLVGCSTRVTVHEGPNQPPSATTGSTAQGSEAPAPTQLPNPPSAPTNLTAAQSHPVEDSYYPQRGEPYLDTLHYGLSLDWRPSTRTLTGRATITFRVTEDRSELQFDLGSALTVRSATVDGRPATTKRGTDTLVVSATVPKGTQHVLVVDYGGTPATTVAPSKRGDQTDGLGFTIEPDGSAWTMQEPFGAFTWYPVNDQPADKAFYDATLIAHEGQKGVFNGVPGQEQVSGDTSVRQFHLDQPASSYLTTVAFGPYTLATDKGPNNLPLYYWYREGRSDSANTIAGLRQTPQILQYLESVLGPYPFASAGSVMVPGDSAMETQTLNTMGQSTATQEEYFLPTLAHEYAHQWVGDVQSPADWRDVWLNESLALFVQAKYEDHADITPYDITMGGYKSMDQQLRRESGPPGKYHKDDFAASNVYVCGAVMYDAMATAYGEKFWAALKSWSTVRKYGNVTRDDLIKHFSTAIGVDLKPWITQWLESETTPTDPPPSLPI